MEQIAIMVPYTFIAPKVQLTWRAIQFGIDAELFSPRDAVDVASELLNKGDDSDAILELASTGQDEPVLEIVASLARAEVQQDIMELRRLWAFLVLAWIFEHRDQYEDPLDLVEKIYADLDYPEQVAPLIRYTPSDEPDLGDPLANEARLFEKWERYLADEGEHFSSRNPGDD